MTTVARIANTAIVMTAIATRMMIIRASVASPAAPIASTASVIVTATATTRTARAKTQAVAIARSNLAMIRVVKTIVTAT